MKKIFLITFLLLSLACSSQAAIPHASGIMSDKDEVYLTPSQEMSVTAERLYIRTSAGGEVSTDVNGRQAYLIVDDVVTVYEVVDTEWCRIGTDRWVACQWLEAE